MDTGGLEQALEPLEVGQALFTQVIEQTGRTHQDGLHFFVLGVEHPQRVAVHAALALFVQLALVLLQVGDQGIAVGGALGALTERVELQGDMIADAEQAPQTVRQHDQLGIDVRPVDAKQLDPELVELAITALLGTLVTEHGAHVPHPAFLVVEQAVLDAGTHAAGCPFRTQAQAVAVAVFKGVHLFFDHVGHFTDGALEQMGLLDDGHAHFAVAVAGDDLAQDLFHFLPYRALLRQAIIHTANSLDLFCHVDTREKEVKFGRIIGIFGPEVKSGCPDAGCKINNLKPGPPQVAPQWFNLCPPGSGWRDPAWPPGRGYGAPGSG